MQIKAADDNGGVLAALADLVARTDLSPAQRDRIEQEVRNVKSGRKGEREAAYEIESYCHDSPNVMTIHDLRIEREGWSAQIDHLVINRYLGMWVCESKSFSEGVEINDQGHWSAVYGGVPRGIPSPVQQNKKQIKVLRSVFDEHIVLLPKRLGLFTIRPIFTGVVLISNRARIVPPANPRPELVADLATVIKAEQLMDTIDRHVDARTSLTAFPATLARMVSRTTIEDIARELAALHSPAKHDYVAKFELKPAGRPTEARAAGSSDAGPLNFPVVRFGPDLATGRSGKSGPQGNAACASCGAAVSAAVIAYCQANSPRFGGRILCFDCQKTARRGNVRRT